MSTDDAPVQEPVTVDITLPPELSRKHLWPRLGVELSLADDDSDVALDIKLVSGGAGHYPTMRTDGAFGMDLDELAALNDWCQRVCRALDRVTGEVDE